MRMRVLAEILHFAFPSIFLKENAKKKLMMVNFLTVLCDGSKDKSVMEQEVAYVAFIDPETGKPALVFFEVVAPSKNKDALGLKESNNQHF